MSMKPGLASIQNTGNKDLDRFCQAVKQTLDSITGQARNVQPLEPLPADATLAQVIERLNVITERLG